MRNRGDLPTVRGALVVAAVVIAGLGMQIVVGADGARPGPDRPSTATAPNASALARAPHDAETGPSAWHRSPVGATAPVGPGPGAPHDAPPSQPHPAQSPDPDPVPPGATADVVLSGDVSRPDGFVVPAGQVWEFDPGTTTTVEVGANVVVEGVLRMRPTSAAVVHTLRFVGVDETGFVGGDAAAPVASDVGLWVVGDGVLDAQGTPRTGWNRTGADASWRAGDDVRVTPTEQGDVTTFAAFVPGSTVPTVARPDGGVQAAEVLNLTRNVVIEGQGPNVAGPAGGRAHVIFLRTRRPQNVRWVALRHLGPRQVSDGRDPTEGVLGRYPLHFHQAGDGSRGTVVEGVVVQASGSHAFVPHSSHGITIRDTVAFDVWESAYWWDPEAPTHDLTLQRAFAGLVRDDPEFRGFRLTGFLLGLGVGNAVTDSAAAGILGNNDASGFHWPEFGNREFTPDGRPNNVWSFRDNVVHNSRADCIFVWQNDRNDHVIEGFTGYNCQDSGVDHGAYVNGYRYRDLVLWNNGVDVRIHALSHRNAASPLTWSGLDVGSIQLVDHSLSSDRPVIVSDLTLRPGGTIAVSEGGGEAGVYRFVSDTLTPGDFRVGECRSEIAIQRGDGTLIPVC